MRLLLKLIVVAGLLDGGLAFAQRPHGTPPGQLKKQGPPGTASVAAPTPDIAAAVDTGVPGGISRVRSLGVWLDDATAMSQGEAWLTVSIQRWGSPIGSGFDAPVFDVVGGIVPRVHAFASIPYSRTTYVGLPSEGELGTVYFGGKAVLKEAGDRVFGVAVTPPLEILSSSAITDTGYSRVNGVLPVNLEWRQGHTRVYGSTGYFTRGAVFMAGAWEQTLTDRVVVTGALSQAWATDDLALAEEVGLRTSRTDIVGSLAWIASPHVMLFGSAARTLSSLDADATRYAFSFGASLNLFQPGRRTPVKKP
jgi:hypothetical protein